MTVAVIQSGVNTAGENFTLECSLNGTNDTDDVTFQWSNEISILNASNISSTITVSTADQYLHFTPLQQQHKGVYTCTAVTVNGATESKSITLSVNGIQLMYYDNSFCYKKGHTVPHGGLEFLAFLNLMT